MNSSIFFQRIISILSFVLFLNFFFFHKLGPVAFVLQALGFFLFVLAAFYEKEFFKKHSFSLLAILAILLLAFFNILRVANFFIAFLFGLLIVSCLAVIVYLLLTKTSFVRCLMEGVFVPFELGRSYFIGGLKVLKLLFSGSFQKQILAKSGNRQRSLFKSLTLGFLASLPIIALLLSLFSRADPIFSTFIKDLVTEGFVKNLPSRLILSLVLLAVLSPFVFLRRKKAFFSPFLEILQRFSFVHEMSVVMGLVALTVAAFLVIQWPYVFVNVPFETELSQFGVATYSEYVKKGFGELVQAALVIFALIWAGLVTLRGKKENQRTILSFVQILVLAEFALFITSIFRRIWLYQAAHGWTLARIYGGFLLFWLSGITATLALRHFWQKKWVIAEALFTVSVILVMGFLNAEHFIAITNPPTVNKRIDYVYLSKMSADGYEGWKRAFERAGEVLLESGLEEKDLLDKEDRREIAYSGVIVRQLAKNYHQLVKEYGNEEEFREYLKAVLEFQRKAIEAAVASKKEEVGDVYLGQPLEELKQQIEGDLQKIEENKIESLEAGNRLGISYFHDTRLKDQFVFGLSQATSFYEIDPFVPGKRQGFYRYKRLQGLDRLFIWNWSKAEAYEKMREEMGIEKLLNLQEKYWEFYKKVISQPEGEQAYGTDISFNAPFLN